MYLIDRFDGPEGGTEGQILQLIKKLDRSRFAAKFCAFRQTKYLKRNQFPCPVEILGIGKIASFETLKKGIALSRDIRRNRIDLVHIFFNDAATVAPFFCRLGGARVVVSRRDMGFWYTEARLHALRFSNLFVDRVLANSQAVKNNVIRRERVPPRKMVLIRNGHDRRRFEVPQAEFFREQNMIGSDDPVIGMVANLYSRKRPGDLIRALKIVRQNRKNAHAVFVGGGNHEIAVNRQLARELEMEEGVHFLGSIPNAIPVIKHFDLGMLCSESEGLSNALIEYMGCAKPIICTNVGGNPELVKDSYNGFLLGVGDINKMAERILTIISNQELCRKMGENGRKLFLENFLAEGMVALHMKLYMTLIANRE